MIEKLLTWMFGWFYKDEYVKYYKMKKDIKRTMKVDGYHGIYKK